MAFRSPTTPELLVTTVAMIVFLLLVVPSSAAQPSLSAMEEEDRVHDFLRVLDRAARYRRECFGECAKGCYCADNPYSCLRRCMPTPPVDRCGATYGAVQDIFASSASFSFGPETVTDDGGAAAGSGEGSFVSRPT